MNRTFTRIIHTFLAFLYLFHKCRATIVFDSIPRNPNGTVVVNGTLLTILWIGGSGDFVKHIPVEEKWNKTFFNWTGQDFLSHVLYQFQSAPNVAAFETNENPDMLVDYYVIIRYEQTLFDVNMGMKAMLRATTSCFDDIYIDASIHIITVQTVVAFGDGVEEMNCLTLRQTDSIKFGYEVVAPAVSAMGNLITPLASYDFYVQAYIDLCLKFGWHKMTVIFDIQDSRDDQVTNILITRAELEGIGIVAVHRVSADTVDARMDVVVESKSRIMLVLIKNEADQRYIYLSAHEHGMIDPYVYVTGRYAPSPGWNEPFIKELMDGGILLQDYVPDMLTSFYAVWERARVYDSQLVFHQPADISHAFPKFEATEYIASRFAMQGYHELLRTGGYMDQCSSVTVTSTICSDWTTTLLNKVCCSLDPVLKHNLKINDIHPVSLIVRYDANNITFPEGPTFIVQEEGTGELPLIVWQYNGDIGVWVQIGFYDHKRVFDLYLPTRFRFGGTKTPLDSPVLEVRRESIAPYAFILVTLFSGISIAFAIGLVVFNNVFRNRKVVWLTSPNMNNVILLGSIGFFVCAILLGVDRNMLSGDKAQFLSLCMARTWLIQISFTLLFGSLVAKIFRVYKVFTSAARCKTSRISDKQLFIVLNVIMFINIILLLAWTFTDTIKSDEFQSRFEADPNDSNLEISNIVEVCSSTMRVGWLSIFIAIDFLLLIFGAFLSYKTRNVAIEILKNAKDVGLAIYTSGLIALLIIPITNSVNDADIGFIITGFGIILGTNVVLVSLFRGPIIAIWKKEEEQVTKLDMNSLRSSQGTGASTELQTTDMPDNTVPSMDTDTTTTTTTSTDDTTN